MNLAILVLARQARQDRGAEASSRGARDGRFPDGARQCACGRARHRVPRLRHACLEPVGRRSASQASPADSFADWDGFEVTHKPIPSARITASGKTPIPPTISSLRPLSVDHWTIELDNPDLRLIKITNALFGRPRGALVVFLRLADKTWRRHDITAQRTLELCRDDPTEDVEEIVLTSMNTAVQGPELGWVEHEVEAHSVCGIGSIEGPFHGSATSEDGLQLSWNGEVTLVRNVPGKGVTGDYPVESGHVTYNVAGPYDDCHVSGTVRMVFMPAGTHFHVSPILDHPLEGPYDYIGHVNAPEFTMPALLTQCEDPDRNGRKTGITVPAALDTGPVEKQTPDGLVYDGAFAEVFDNGARHEWSWSLRAGRTDLPAP